MENIFNYRPKDDAQLKKWFSRKLTEGKNAFPNFNEFANWYNNSKKECHYCGISERESQQIVMKGKLTSNRFPQEGINGKGTSRGMWLEIDKYNPNGNYEIDNVVLACYFCNNDKSDVFHGDEYKVFAKDRLAFLKSLLVTLLFPIVIFTSCKEFSNNEITEEIAKEIIKNEFNKESNGLVEVLELQKIDGIKQEFAGQEFYKMKFKIKIRFKKNAHAYKPVGHKTMAYHSDEWLEKRLKLHFESEKAFEHYLAGDIKEYESQNLFDRTENGWNY